MAAFIRRLLNLLLHLVAIGAVIALLRPIADWYLNLAQVPGSDYWNTATYLQRLSQDLHFPAGKWFYHWFTGTPAATDYPWLHLYLMQPLVKIYGVIQAQHAYALVSLAVFGVFTYLWLERMVNGRGLRGDDGSAGGKTAGIATSSARSKGDGGVLAMTGGQLFAAALTVTLLYSSSLYPAITIIGSTTFFATQSFLPITLYCLESWRQGGSKRWFYLAVLTAGLTMYGHPAIGLVFVLPLGLLVILCLKPHGIPMSIGMTDKSVRLGWAARFLGLTLLIGGAGLSHFFLTIFKSFSGGAGEKYVKLEAVSFVDLFPGGVASLNWLIIGVLGVVVVIYLASRLINLSSRSHGIASSRASRNPRNDKEIMGRAINPYLVGFAYLVIFYSLLIAGFNPLSGLLHGPRLAWVGTLVMAGLAASLFGKLLAVPRSSSDSRQAGMTMIASRFLTWGGAVSLIVAFWFYRPALFQLIKEHAGLGYPYPGVVSGNLNADQIEKLKANLTPEWLDTQEKNYRLYSLDDRLNMWWNGLYDLPQVRGYYAGVSPPEKEAFLGLLDNSVMEDELVKVRGFTVEEAENVARFYLDWYGVKYLAITPRFQLSSYLNNDSVIKQNQRVQGVNYLELNEQVGSPILSPNNSPTLCILGSDKGYNYLLRTLAKFNLNSRKLVLIKGPSFIGQVDDKFLKACDSLIVYTLKSRLSLNPVANNQGWRAVADKVKSGASVFIDSGEVGSVGNRGFSLPEVFPVSVVEQQAVEGEWQWEIDSQDELLGEVEVKNFSPPKWEEYGWKLSYSKQESLKDWAKPILEHQGKPVLVRGKLGKGQVIWSGLNLPFHLDYYDNEDEAQLLLNIINRLVELPEEERETPAFALEWISPEERRLTFSKAKGVLFKENGRPGWVASTDTGDRLPIYHAGPNYPGFMHVKLPEGFVGAVGFTYRGSLWTWVSFGVAGLVIILILEEILLKGKLSGMLSSPLRRKVGKKLSLKKWWEEE